MDGVELPRVDIAQQLGKAAFSRLGEGDDALGLVDGQNAVVFEENPDRGKSHFF
jgi:hypothetical protein